MSARLSTVTTTSQDPSVFHALYASSVYNVTRVEFTAHSTSHVTTHTLDIHS